MSTTTRYLETAKVGGRCSVCAQALFVKLTRDAKGSLQREAYCPACDVSANALEVTTPAGRRAALLRASSRRAIKQGAA